MGPNFNKGHAPYLEPRYYDQAFDLVACTTAYTGRTRGTPGGGITQKVHSQNGLRDA
jgi:hypothetical protein